jgi:hemerythrin
MKKLKQLANEHFITESGLYNNSMYPDKAGHDRLHAQFMQELLELEKRASAGAAGEKFAVEIRERLTDWFVLHIQKNDIQMASYILQKQ